MANVQINHETLPDQLSRYLKYNEELNRLVSSLPMGTDLNSWFLGEQHKMSSGAENIFFTNLTSDIDWFPMWGGLKDQSKTENQGIDGTIAPSGRVYGDYQDLEFYGPLRTNIVGYESTIVNLPSSNSVFGIQFYPAEQLLAGDVLSYQIHLDNSEGTVLYEQHIIITNETANTGDGSTPIEFWFDHPAENHQGDNLYVSLKRNDSDGNLLQVFDNTTTGSQYIRLRFRTFEDKDLAFLEDKESIVNLNGSEDYDHIKDTVYLIDANVSQQKIIIKDDVTSTFTVRDINNSFYDNTPIIQLLNSDGTNSHTVTLNKSNKSYYFYNSSGVWYFSEEGRGKSKAITENLTSSIVFEDIYSKISEVENISNFDIHVDADYTGTLKTGSSLHPYTDVNIGFSNVPDGGSILLKGDLTSGFSTITLDPNKEYNVTLTNNCILGYENFDNSNGSIIKDTASTRVKNFSIKGNGKIQNGKYGIYIKYSQSIGTDTFKIDDSLRFRNCGWDGQNVSLILAESEGILGFDSDQTDLSNFWNGGNGVHVSNGGALRVHNASIVECDKLSAKYCLRGFRWQDCGIGGRGIVTNISATQNIDNGIYLASSTYSASAGCENFLIDQFVSTFNGHQGMLIIGGKNNTVGIGSCYGNWGSGEYYWHPTDMNYKLANSYDNNRSAFTAYGANADAPASSAISYDPNNTRTDQTYLLKLISLDVQNTNIGANTKRVGFKVFHTPLTGSTDYNKNIIQVETCILNNQDDAIDLSECDCEITQVIINNVTLINNNDFGIVPPLNGQPVINNILHPSIKHLDVSIDNTGSFIKILEGINGIELKGYNVNELKAISNGQFIRIVKTEGNVKLFNAIPVSNCTIDGVAVNSVLSNAINDLNGLFTNTIGFGGQPNAYPTSFTLVGDDLILTLSDATIVTQDITSLQVDTNSYVVSGSPLDATTIRLTLSDTNTIDIDITSILNGFVSLEGHAPILVSQQFKAISQSTINFPVDFFGAVATDGISIVNAPSNLSINANTGVITGTAEMFNTSGTGNVYTFQVVIVGANGRTSYSNISMIITSGIVGDIAGWTELQGAFNPSPAQALELEDTLASYDTVLTSDNRFEFPFISQGYLGVINGTTPAPNTNVSLSSEWDLRVEFGATEIVTGSNVGWDAVLTTVTYNSGSSFFIEYRDDTFIYLVIDGVDVLKTSAAYTSDFTIYHGTPDAYTTNTDFPVFTLNQIPSSSGGGGGSGVCTKFDGALYSTSSSASNTVKLSEFPAATAAGESPLIHTGGTADDWSMTTTVLYNSAGLGFFGLCNGSYYKGANWYVPTSNTTSIRLGGFQQQVTYTYQNDMFYTMILSYNSESFTLTATLIDTENSTIIFSTSVTSTVAANGNYFTGGKFGIYQGGTNASNENISYGLVGAVVDMAFYDKQIIDVLGADINMWKNPAAYADDNNLIGVDKGDKTKLYAFSDTGSNDGPLANVKVINQIDQADIHTLNVLANYNNTYGTINVPNLTGTGCGSSNQTDYSKSWLFDGVNDYAKQVVNNDQNNPLRRSSDGSGQGFTISTLLRNRDTSTQHGTFWSQRDAGLNAKICLKREYGKLIFYYGSTTNFVKWKSDTPFFDNYLDYKRAIVVFDGTTMQGSNIATTNGITIFEVDLLTGVLTDITNTGTFTAVNNGFANQIDGEFYVGAKSPSSSFNKCHVAQLSITNKVITDLDELKEFAIDHTLWELNRVGDTFNKVDQSGTFTFALNDVDSSNSTQGWDFDAYPKSSNSVNLSDTSTELEKFNGVITDLENVSIPPYS